MRRGGLHFCCWVQRSHAHLLRAWRESLGGNFAAGFKGHVYICSGVAEGEPGYKATLNTMFAYNLML